MRTRIAIIVAWLGRMGIAFLLLFAAFVAMGWAAPGSGIRLVAGLGALFTGVWLAFRVMRRVTKQTVWRLRNRLLVTYLFIAVVPIMLIVGLAVLAAYSLVNQMAVYLVTSELDRKRSTLWPRLRHSVAQSERGRAWRRCLRRVIDLVI